MSPARRSPRRARNGVAAIDREMTSRAVVCSCAPITPMPVAAANRTKPNSPPCVSSSAVRSAAGIAEPEQAAQAEDHEALEQDQRQHEADDLAPPLEQQREIDRHADGDEEQAQQQTLERRDLGRDLVVKRRAREEDADNEGAERRRQAGMLRQPGGGEHGQHGQDRERLGTASGARSSRRRAAAPDGRSRRSPPSVTAISPSCRPIAAASGSLEPGASSGTSASSGITAMSCNSRIAKAARPCSVASSSRSARSGSTKAVEDRARPKPEHQGGRPWLADGRRGCRQHQPGEHDLQRAEAEQGAPHRPDPRQLELQADDEQQEHHAQLGRGGDGAQIDHRPRRVRPEHDADHEQTRAPSRSRRAGTAGPPPCSPRAAAPRRSGTRRGASGGPRPGSARSATPP